MRRTVATVLAAAALLGGTGLATSASAVCGGGQPGEECYCPNTVEVGKYEITLYSC